MRLLATFTERISPECDTKVEAVQAQAEIVAVDVKGKVAQVTIAFVSQLISAVRDSQGTVVDGSADAVSEVNDVWTFSRQLGSRDPNWLLVATESAA